MPTSKVIRPAVFDETGEHVIPADADLNLDPVSSDPDNYIVRGSDGGAFLNGDGVLSNDGENLLKTSPNDGKVTYPRSDAVSLINETVQPSLDRLEDKADKAQAAADRAQATADKAAEDAAAAQCAAGQALDKAQEAIDKLPEIADAHSSIVTAGDGIKVDQSKLGDHNVYQVSVKRNGEDSGLISSTDGLEVELKGNGGIDKDRDGLYVDQQWIDEMVARYAKDHMLFNQFKIVKQLPAIPDADVHTIYLIRNKDSSATDAGTKDSFDGWFIATTENGTQKWEEAGYKTDLTGYTHKGNTVNITGYVSGTGTVDANGNVTVDVVADIRDTPYTYYVGKTNARDYWGKDENGNQWGSTKDHPFASLGYAINETNKHIFPGNAINIYVNDSGEYVEDIIGIFVTSYTIVHGTTSEHPVFRCWWDMNLSAGLKLSAVDFAIRKIPAADSYPEGIPLLRVEAGSGELRIENGCHMVIDSDNFGKNVWPFIVMGGSSSLSLTCNNGPALYLELRGNGVTHKASYIAFDLNSSFGIPIATGSMAAIKLVSPSGTKHTGPVLSLGRFTETRMLTTTSPYYKMYFDWDIADDSGTTQVYLGKFAFLELYKNPGKGQALPGSSVGNVPDLAEYHQWDYA